jgi:hypothetical protein
VKRPVSRVASPQSEPPGTPKAVVESSAVLDQGPSPKRGRPENLKRGRTKVDPPTRKTSEQKITEFCWYYLTHGESIRAAGLHVGLSLSYIYEFFNKPEVRAKIVELPASLKAEMLEAQRQRIRNFQFIDERLAEMMAAPPDPKRGYADNIAAARLAAEMGGFIDKCKAQVAQFPNGSAQIIPSPPPFKAERFARVQQQGDNSKDLVLVSPDHSRPEDSKND